VCLTGVSMGGYGTWRLALDHPHRFAALVPVCGGLGARRERLAGQPLSDPHRTAARRLRHVPAWIFHGADDPIIPVSESRSMAEALREVEGEVRYTEYPGVGHKTWDLAYAEPGLMPWMLAPHTAEQPVAG
jgi:predicted peptidase